MITLNQTGRLQILWLQAVLMTRDAQSRDAWRWRNEMIVRIPHSKEGWVDLGAEPLSYLGELCA